MKVCYVINSLDGGGGALPLPNILGILHSAGHDIFVVALMERDGRARAGLDAAGIPYVVIGGSKRSYIRTALRLSGIVRAQAPDLLWTSLSHATVTGQLVGRLHGIPVVSWLHNAWLKPVNAAIMRRTKALSRHWIADSATVGQFGSQTLGIPPERISIWPIFQANPAWQNLRKPHGESFRIGSLGRLHANKGYDVLLNALALLKRRRPDIDRLVSVSIGGEGPERGNLERQAEKLGLSNVKFPGFVEPAAFLRQLDCYVQPSHHEGFCIAAHEAMCAGLPVIASPVGEMARSIEASAGGCLVPYGDAEGLSYALERYAGDPAQAAQEGARGQTWAMLQYSPAAFATHGLNAVAAAERAMSGSGRASRLSLGRECN